MLKNGNTLHFINRVDNNNCGDRMVTPLLYYYDYFKQYHIKRHDMRFIDIESISDSDVVIIGGGGMFDYAEFTNRAINKVLDRGAAVIAWSPGFNTHGEYDGTFKTEINFDRFKLLTVRDYADKHGLGYLPDVTCKLSGLKENYTIQRKYGVAQHKDYPIPGMDYDTITNEQGIDEILRFIGESEVVISNSFHMIYWAMLMGKKTICASPFSSKFFSYKYKPEYFWPEKNSLHECAERAKKFNILDECIRANDEFFEQVKAIIEERLTPVADNYWTTYDLLTQEALLKQQIRELQPHEGDLLVSQLFVDNGDGFNESRKLVSINNVYGDAQHSVRFDLTGYDTIKALRFDPIECRNCEVEILSAKTSTGSVKMIAQAAVKEGSSDKFLTTDPQYYVGDPCADFLEIVFTLRLLTSYEAEQNIYTYAGQLGELIGQKDARIGGLTGQLEQKEAHLVELNGQLRQKDAQLIELNSHLGEKEAHLVELNGQLRQKDAQLIELNDHLGEKEAHLVELNGQLRQKDAQLIELNDHLGEKEAHLVELNSRLEQKDAHLIELNDHLGEKETHLVELNGQLRQKDAQLIELNSHLGEKEAKLVGLIDRLGQKDEQIFQQIAVVREQASELEQQKLLIMQMTDQLHQMTEQCDQQQEVIAQIYASKSWKITAPFRRIEAFFKRIMKGKK